MMAVHLAKGTQTKIERLSESDVHDFDAAALGWPGKDC